MPRRKSLVLATVTVLVCLVATSVTYSAYALGPPDPSIAIDLHFDYNTARGFEKEVKAMGGDFGATPEFVLGRGRTATMNLTFTAVREFHAVMDENATARIPSIWYGGTPPYKNGWSGGNSLPPGVTARIATQNITLPPGSKETITLEISATPDAAIGSYNLEFSYRFVTPSYRYGMISGHSTVLTVVEPTASFSSSTTATTTTTTTVTQTSTSTITLSNAVTTTTTSMTTTIPEQVTEPSTYAWAVSATIAAAVLAVVLLMLQRRSK